MRVETGVIHIRINPVDGGFKCGSESPVYRGIKELVRKTENEEIDQKSYSFCRWKQKTRF